ncbi:MAG: TIGR00269 family protein [Promethearchaeota archaeon]
MKKLPELPVHCKFFSHCKNNAVTEVPFSKIPLCKDHFISYIHKRVKKTIEEQKLIDFKDPKEKILVALSGGKDSQVLLTILKKVIKSKVKLEGLYINVGISPEHHTDRSQATIQKLCDDLKVHLNIVYLKNEMDFNMDDVNRVGQSHRPHSRERSGRFRGNCSYCGLFKRYFINKFAALNGFTKVATGHNLTDESTQLLGNFFSIDMELMARAGPKTITNVEGLIPRIKPLFFIYESELFLYAYYQRIPHVIGACPYSSGSTMHKIKRTIWKIEEIKRGNQMNMVLNFQKELREILIKTVPEDQQIARKCSVCGMPTYLETCSFCKTKKRLQEQIQILEIKQKKRENRI